MRAKIFYFMLYRLFPLIILATLLVATLRFKSGNPTAPQKCRLNVKLWGYSFRWVKRSTVFVSLPKYQNQHLSILFSWQFAQMSPEAAWCLVFEVRLSKSESEKNCRNMKWMTWVSVVQLKTIQITCIWMILVRNVHVFIKICLMFLLSSC